MKLTVDRTLLLKALSHAQSVVEKRHTLPILGHVLLEAHDQTLTLTATDMELNLIENLEADIESAGALTVSAAMIFDITRKIDSDTLTLFEKDHQLHIHGGRSRFKLGYLSAEDFPKLSSSDLPISFTLPVNDLKQLLEKPRFAMATEETRYYLNGIYWHTLSSEGHLRAVATDAHRLAMTDVPMPEGAADMPGIIISRKTVNEVRKLLEEEESCVHIAASDARIAFTFSKAHLSSRLIDGQFPDYMQAVPTQNNRVFFVPTKSLTKVVDRVATVVNDKVRVIKMDVSDHQVVLSAASSELGSAREDLPISYEGDEGVSIGFNAKYLLDITQQIPEEETEVRLHDGNSPTIVKGAGDSKSTYVIMPMRI